MGEIDALLATQSGVIARRQVEAAGETAADIERRLRRREWARLLPGVYVDHTGPASWVQRAWAGVLYYAPAVVGDESILVDPSRRHDESRVVIAVDRQRNVTAMPGYVVRWVTGLETKSLAHTSPPRMRIEDAALRVAARHERELDAVQTVASCVQRRLTTADRMLVALDRHPRLPRRRWLAEVLHDVAAGSHSVLERQYYAKVERAHCLPVAHRQCRTTGARVRYSDASYPDQGVDVELDGRLVHDTAEQRHDDLERDL